MQNYPLFPRAVRLALYAGTAIASLAAMPAVVRHARQAMDPVVEEDSSGNGPDVSAATSHQNKGSISIQPVQPDAAARRKAELAALQAKLQAAAK
jgi:hypothetical protein